MKILDLTTIILTYNEELHIQRCLENVCPFSKKVIVVDSPSSDRTVEICNEFENVEVVVHKYPGNQAEQFNWALEYLEINTEWILRLDADEYLFPELIEEIQNTLPKLPENISALSLPRARAFMGKRLKYGIVKSVRLVRCFRFGKARYEQRLMDEQLVVLEGETVEMQGEFIDDNIMPLHFFIAKHNDYALREVIDQLNNRLNLMGEELTKQDLSKGVQSKRTQKDLFSKLPLFWRSFAYFCYRYFFKLGFLDGKEGFVWDFFQGFWYRTLVDAKLFEIQKECGEDKVKIIEYLNKMYSIDLSKKNENINSNSNLE